MTEIKNIDDIGSQFLIKEEGLVKRPYRDQRGIPTIGVGMTYYPDTGKRVKITDPALTTEQCISYYKMILKPYEISVWSVTRDDINQNQFNAQVSLSYNIGVSGYKASSLVKLVNENPNNKSISIAFQLWKNAGGNPILLDRRKREAKLYFTPVINLKKTPEQIYVEHVKFIQTKLHLAVDGIFGKNTRSAVIAFQLSVGLEADGIVGPRTLEELNKLP